MPSLNQIFFGPPGTGKTYATVEATLQILDQPFLASNPDDRTAWKKRFVSAFKAEPFTAWQFSSSSTPITGPEGPSLVWDIR